MKNEIELKIRVQAKKIVIKELEKNGLDFTELEESDFEMLVDKRVCILEKDVKSLGFAAAISLAITAVTGI